MTCNGRLGKQPGAHASTTAQALRLGDALWNYGAGRWGLGTQILQSTIAYPGATGLATVPTTSTTLGSYSACYCKGSRPRLPGAACSMAGADFFDTHKLNIYIHVLVA